ARVYSTSFNSRFRLQYRNGDGPLISMEWKEAPVVNGWSEIFLAEVSLDAAQLGTQTSELRVQQKDTESAAAKDITYVLLWPTMKDSGKARGIANNTVTNLISYDNFEQSAGNLEGKEPNYPSAITWAETNKTGANGFKVNASHWCERAITSDSTVNSGC